MPFLDDSVLDRIAGHGRRAHHSLMHGGETLMRRTIDALEVGGTAALFGYVGGRYGSTSGGEYTLAGLPVDLWGALLGLGLAWFGLAGDYERDAEMIGAGALASYLARQGASWGAQAAAAAPEHTSGRQELVGARRPPHAFAAAAQAAAAQAAGQTFAVRPAA